MLKRQAKKERWTMAGLTESILREALRKREPRSISNDRMFETPRDEVKDLKIAEQVDAMVKANDKV